MLTTGTASPPPWLVTAHPEILPVTVDGKRLAPGSRIHLLAHLERDTFSRGSPVRMRLLDIRLV